MNTKKNKLLFVLGSLIVIAGLATAVLIASGSASEGTSSSRARSTSDSKSSQPAPASSTTEGTFECLTHKGDGPQTLECGLGLRTDDGVMYALRSDDPAALGSVPMGKRIRVTGTVTEEATQYDTAGTIRVEKLEQL